MSGLPLGGLPLGSVIEMTEFQKAIGVRENPHAAKNPVNLQDPDYPPPDQLNWALHWGSCGVPIFPGAEITGSPLVKSWIAEASKGESRIIQWWCDEPAAEIGAVPDKAGCYVIVIVGDRRLEYLDFIEEVAGEPLLETMHGIDNALHFWFPGRAPTQRLASGLYVLGVGCYLYMPGSMAPDPLVPLNKREPSESFQGIPRCQMNSTKTRSGIGTSRTGQYSALTLCR